MLFSTFFLFLEIVENQLITGNKHRPSGSVNTREIKWNNKVVHSLTNNTPKVRLVAPSFFFKLIQPTTLSHAQLTCKPIDRPFNGPSNVFWVRVDPVKRSTARWTKRSRSHFAAQRFVRSSRTQKQSSGAHQGPSIDVSVYEPASQIAPPPPEGAFRQN